MTVDANWVALLVALSTFLSPMLMALIVNQAARSSKIQDWARQDAVAVQAAEAARLLLASQEKIADRAAKVAVKLDESTTVVNDKLDVIHTLVNSSMTAAMQAEHDATVLKLSMMEEVVNVKRLATKEEPSLATLAAMSSTRTRIKELDAALADRLEQSKIVEAQQASQRAASEPSRSS